MEEIKYKGYTIQIEQDDSPSNPRKDDNLGKMVCYHRYYRLGDDHEYRTEEEFKEWLRANEKKVVMLPLYLYDHSGIRIRTTRSDCDSQGWDTSMVGVIYVTKERIKEEYSLKRNVSKRRAEMVKDILRVEVETYDQYLTGDVYGYKVIDPYGEEVNSCYGYYGYDHEKSGLLKAAQSEVDADIRYRLKYEGIQEELALTV